MNFLLLKINNRYIIKKNFKEILQMKDTIDKLVDIDNQSRAIINKCEEKEENLDNYVTIELEKRKAEINAK